MIGHIRFPHEPIPSTPKVGPYRTPVVGGEMYHYCTCGESTTQPWCEAPGDKCGKFPEFVSRAYEVEPNRGTLEQGRAGRRIIYIYIHIKEFFFFKYITVGYE